MIEIKKNKEKSGCDYVIAFLFFQVTEILLQNANRNRKEVNAAIAGE